MWWIVGGIVAVVLMLYRMAKRIEELEQRVFEIEMDLLDVGIRGGHEVSAPSEYE